VPYKAFTLEKVRKQFGLAIESNQDLFARVSQPIPLAQEFTAYLNYSVPLALSINTEKARSKMVIAPMLVQLKRLLNDQISLFSGVEFAWAFWSA